MNKRVTRGGEAKQGKRLSRAESESSTVSVSVALAHVIGADLLQAQLTISTAELLGWWAAG